MIMYKYIRTTVQFNVTVHTHRYALYDSARASELHTSKGACTL